MKRSNENNFNNSTVGFSSSNKNLFAVCNAKSCKVEKKPLIYQISSSQLSEFREVSLFSNDPIFSLNTPHQWSSKDFTNNFYEFSSDGRMVYITQPKNLIIVDLFLNTHAIMKNSVKNESRLFTRDFAVLNSNTILASTNNKLQRPDNILQLQLIDLFVDEGRFESRTLFHWNPNEAPSGIVVSNVIDESTKLPVTLLGHDFDNPIMISRLEVNQFVLNSIVQLPALSFFCDLTNDGAFLRILNSPNFKVNTYDLKNQIWSEEQLSEIRPQENYLQLYRSDKFLYAWNDDRPIRIDREGVCDEKVLHRMDLQTKKWTKITLGKITGVIKQFSTIKNASGEEVCIQILCLHRFRRSKNLSKIHCTHFVKRLMYTPEPLATLCWFKIQELFTDYDGKNVFEVLRKSGPLKKMFPPIYSSMKPIKKFSL